MKLSSDFQSLKYHSFPIQVDVCLAFRFLAPATHVFKMGKSTSTSYLNIYLSKTCGILGTTFSLLFFLKVTHFFFTSMPFYLF